MLDLELPKYSLTFNRPVVGFGNFTKDISNSTECMIDRTIVNQKFALWDYVLRENLLTHPDPNVSGKVKALLHDKTIFAYQFFKFNGKPFKSRWTQDIVLSDRSKKVVFCACNQFLGKSTTLDIDAATEFCFDHDKRWVGILVSNSLTQSQERMSNIKMLLNSMDIMDYRTKDIDLDSKGKSNATQISIYFYDSKKKPLYSNLLICCPHTSAALGYPADDIYLDEVDFWEDVRGGQEHFLNQVIIPRTFETGGDVRAYSNPNGCEKMMFILWNQKDQKENYVWHRYQFNYWDKINPSQEEFDEKCVGFTESEIDSTLLAKFARTEGSFFSKSEIEDMLDQDLIDKGDQAGFGRETVWFMDVGSVHDQSVLAGGYLEPNPDFPEIPLIKIFWIHKYPVGYPLARVVGIDSAIQPDDGWEDYVSDNPSVREVLGMYADRVGDKSYQPLFGFDATGNSGMVPLFEAAGIDGVDVQFQGRNKWKMYQRFQYYVQQRFIKRGKERDFNTVRGCNFDYQMAKLVVKKNTNTSYRQIHHENENDLDDCGDVIAALIWLIENPDLPRLDFAIIPHAQVGVVNNSQQEPSTNKSPAQNNIIPSDQYIPSFINKSELTSWIAQKENQYH